MNQFKLSIVTIAYKNYNELIETIDSIDSQDEEPFENILVLSGFSNLQKEKLVSNYSKPFRKFFWDIDSSLFNAMNVGIEKSSGNYLLFLNAGDFFVDRDKLSLIKSFKININSVRSCISFKTYQVYKEISVIRENQASRFLIFLRREKTLPPHQGFIAPNIKKIRFNENLRVSADNDWMIRNMNEYGVDYSSDILANFKLGGQSTYPTLKIIYIKLKYEKFARFLIECAKYLFSLFVTREIYFITMAKLRGYKIIKR